MVETAKLNLRNFDPTFTVGRKFRNTKELRRWVNGYEYVSNGKLYVLRAIHDTQPEELDPRVYDDGNDPNMEP